MKSIRKTTLYLVIISVLIFSCSFAAADNSAAGGDDLMREMFTERDFDPGYDSAVDITLADNGSRAQSNAVRIDGNTVTVTQEGTYRLSGSLSQGQILVYGKDSAKIQLVLDTVSITNEGGAAIEVISADKVFITTAEGSENSLSSVGQLKNDDVDAAVYAKSDICFNGAGMLRISSESGHGIATKDDLKICSGSYEILAEKRGLSGKDSIRIGGGDIRVESAGDGLHSEHDDADKGFIFIGGGSLDISSGKDGIDCSSYLRITDGTVTIDAASDGINAAGADDFADDACVEISGGRLDILAAEDGIDSNGSINISGGEIFISAAPNGGDAGIDYCSGAVISGGTVAAASSKEMAVNFSSAPAQGSMLCFFAQQHPAGEKVELSNSDGNVILSFSPELDFSAVLLSCADIAPGEKYTVSAGDESLEAEMSDSLYCSGFGGPMGGFGGPMGGFGGPMGGFGHGHGGMDPAQGMGQPADIPGDMPPFGAERPGPGAFGNGRWK